jgi:poly(3-hydroxybutyrate) depolymerase
LYILYLLTINIESYSINKNKITVSGVSSGAAMASQMHIAYSSTIIGSGIIAGRK